MKLALFAVAAAAVLALAAVGALVALGGSGDSVSFRGSRPPAGNHLPDLSLRDYTGRAVRTRELRGKALAVTFLDSQCEQACPVIAAQVHRALPLLEPGDRRRVEALALSTDPREDTPASVRAFLRKQRAADDLTYLVGPPAELARAWRALHVLSSAASGSDDMHSAPVRIYDRDGEWVSTLHAGVDLTPRNLAHDLRAALRS